MRTHSYDDETDWLSAENQSYPVIFKVSSPIRSFVPGLGSILDTVSKDTEDTANVYL